MFVTMTRAEFKPDRMAEMKAEVARLAGLMTQVEGYRGTETLRDVENEHAYLFLLRWEHRQAWEAYRNGLYQQEVVTKFEPLADTFQALGQYELIEA